jgi:hypothetical protein
LLPSPTYAIVRPRSVRALLQRQEVGDRLARMLLVGERVDTCSAAPPRRTPEHLLREGADDDRVDPALEIARDVGDRLAPAERDVRLQRDDVAAELADAISKVVRVRSDGLSKSIATWRPSSASAVGAWRPSERSAFSCAASCRQRSRSAASKSRIDRKSLRRVVASSGVIRFGNPR